jgi:hypothetical protein
MDPTFDPKPAPDEKCSLCGVKGDHVVEACPENRSPKSLTMRRRLQGAASPKEATPPSPRAIDSYRPNYGEGFPRPERRRDSFYDYQRDLSPTRPRLDYSLRDRSPPWHPMDRDYRSGRLTPIATYDDDKDRRAHPTKFGSGATDSDMSIGWASGRTRTFSSPARERSDFSLPARPSPAHSNKASPREPGKESVPNKPPVPRDAKQTLLKIGKDSLFQQQVAHQPESQKSQKKKGKTAGAAPKELFPNRLFQGNAGAGVFNRQASASTTGNTRVTAGGTMPPPQLTAASSPNFVQQQASLRGRRLTKDEDEAQAAGKADDFLAQFGMELSFGTPAPPAPSQHTLRTLAKYQMKGTTPQSATNHPISSAAASAPAQPLSEHAQKILNLCQPHRATPYRAGPFPPRTTAADMWNLSEGYKQSPVQDAPTPGADAASAQLETISEMDFDIKESDG